MKMHQYFKDNDFGKIISGLETAAMQVVEAPKDSAVQKIAIRDFMQLNAELVAKTSWKTGNNDYGPYFWCAFINSKTGALVFKHCTMEDLLFKKESPVVDMRDTIGSGLESYETASEKMLRDFNATKSVKTAATVGLIVGGWLGATASASIDTREAKAIQNNPEKDPKGATEPWVSLVAMTTSGALLGGMLAGLLVARLAKQAGAGRHSG